MISQPMGSAAVSLPSAPTTLPCQDLISIRDLDASEIKHIFNLAARLKSHPQDFRGALAGKHIAMFFEKPSLRTRLTFEAGVSGLGGSITFVDQTSGRLDARETLSDIAHNLERWVSGIVLRTFAHSTVEGMASYARVPVVNALSDLEHPCQALSDYFTLQQRFGNLKNICLAYVGDGNNVAHSLLLTSASIGSTMRIATPKGYELNEQIVADAREIASHTGAIIELLTDPYEAVAGADAIYTDAWTSMGQEHEQDERARIFPSYQLNNKLASEAAPHAVFMHCLPARRGEEITDEIMDSPRSIVFDQAESRLHVQKAILVLLLGGETSRMPVRNAHA